MKVSNKSTLLSVLGIAAFASASVAQERPQQFGLTPGQVQSDNQRPGRVEEVSNDDALQQARA